MRRRFITIGRRRCDLDHIEIWALALILDNQRKIMATLEEANAAVQQLKTDIEAFLASVQPGQLTPEQQALVDNIAATAQSVDGEISNVGGHFRRNPVAVMADLTKTRTLLVLSHPRRDVPTFRPEGDEEEHVRDYVLELDRDVWSEMGEPETITVTIEPGDLLNVEDDV